MFEYNVHLTWKRETEDFDYKTYNRKHTVFFYGGPKIEISASPHFIRNPTYQSPEELLIAAVSSSYLLTFLSTAAKKGFIVNSYLDNATCHLEEVDENKSAVTEIILRPVIGFQKANKPDEIKLNQLFDSAYESCFIVNSLTASIAVRPEIVDN